MQIKIYQINMDRDTDRVAFERYENLLRFQGTQEIQGEIYDLVYAGEVACKTLEGVYQMFNYDHPEGYRGRSLSVSDVVEVIDTAGGKSTFHYCDEIGFQEVEFDPEKCQTQDTIEQPSAEKIRVLLVKVGEPPKPIEIPNTLSAKQEIVGGRIEEYMPFDDEVAIICNEEGKLGGYPPNREIYADPREIEMSYQKMKELFRQVEAAGENHLTGYLVFSQESFQEPYPEVSRTYRISSNNKAFANRMGRYSIFGACLDGSDPHVRLDYYMADERGGKDGWKIERCYVKEDRGQYLDTIMGDFIICLAPIESEKYQSLPDPLMKKYSEKFRCPERFEEQDGRLHAIPIKPKEKGLDR